MVKIFRLLSLWVLVFLMNKVYSGAITFQVNGKADVEKANSNRKLWVPLNDSLNHYYRFLSDIKKTLELQTQVFDESEVDSLIKQYNLALSILNNLNFNSELIKFKISLLTQMGNLNRQKGRYGLAVELYEDALKLSNKYDIPIKKAVILNSLGGLFYEVGNHKTSIDYCLKALHIYKENYPEKTSDICLLLTNIGNIYLTIGETENALNFLNEALEINLLEGNQYYFSLIYSGLGSAMMNEENYEESEVYFQEALSASKKSNSHQSQIAILANLGQLFYKKKEIDKANEYLNEAYQMASLFNEAYLIREVLKLQIQFAEELGDYKRAFELQKQYVQIIQSDFSDDIKNKLISTELKVENILREKELLELQIINQQNQFKIKRNQYFIAFSILLILGSILGFLIWIQKNKYKNFIKLRELEMKMIRLQIKPHFLFNVLSSIQGYMSSNQGNEASVYLSKFARLIRNVLELSKSEFVPLERELQSIQYYMELQQLRFNFGFEFNLNIDDRLKNQNVKVPPLLIQPLLENAIEHGLSKTKRGGSVSMDFVRVDEQRLKINIKDNATSKYGKNHNKFDDYKGESMSLNIIKQQLEYFKSKFKNDFYIKLYKTEKKSGTLVELVIPYFIK